MRDLVFTLILVGLLPLAVARPFVGVLLWSWISFMNPHQMMWGFAQSLPWAMLVFCCTILGCILAGEPRRLAVNAVTVLLALFMVCITLTSFTALGAPDPVWKKWEWATKILIGLLLTAALLTDRRRIHALVWLMVIAIGFFGVKGGLFTVVTGGGNIVMGPPSSIIADRNHLAAAMLISIPLMNYLRLHSRHRIVRIGLIVAMVTTLFAVVGSQSRGALLALAATALFLWLRSPRKLLSGLAILACVAVALNFMPDSWWQRMSSIEHYEEDASSMGRIQIWMTSLQIALAHPWTGGGFLSMYMQAVVDQVVPGAKALAAHSIWFEVLGEHGFPTFFVWLGIILSGVAYSMRIIRLARERPDLRWAADLARMSQVSVVAYASAGTFLSLNYWDFFWTLMVVMAATHAVVVAAVREGRRSEAGAVRDTEAGWRRRAGPAMGVAAAAARPRRIGPAIATPGDGAPAGSRP